MDMDNGMEKRIAFLVLIAGRKQKDALLTMMTGMGCGVINILYGRGSVKAGYLKDMLGLHVEENKVLITCLIRDEKAEEVMKNLTETFEFNRPNTGIAFTVPVRGVLY